MAVSVHEFLLVGEKFGRAKAPTLVWPINGERLDLDPIETFSAGVGHGWISVCFAGRCFYDP